MQKQLYVTKSSVSDKIKFNCSRFYSDTSKIKPKDGEETIPRNNWQITLDHRTCYKVSKFYDKKVI